jgi:hypothetical protein
VCGKPAAVSRKVCSHVNVSKPSFKNKGFIIKIKIYRTIILTVVLYGCENLLLKLREKHRLRVFENRVVRKIFGPKRDEVKGSEDQTTKSFMICIIYKHFSDEHIKKNKMGGLCSTYGGKGEVHIGFWQGGLREKSTWQT